jgi:hypothetical protein
VNSSGRHAINLSFCNLQNVEVAVLCPPNQASRPGPTPLTHKAQPLLHVPGPLPRLRKDAVRGVNLCGLTLLTLTWRMVGAGVQQPGGRQDTCCHLHWRLLHLHQQQQSAASNSSKQQRATSCISQSNECQLPPAPHTPPCHLPPAGGGRPPF